MTWREFLRRWPTAERLTNVYIYIMLLIFPLWFDGNGYTSITAAKYLFFRNVTVVWLVLLAARLIVERRAWWRQGNAAQKLLIFFLLWSCLSAVCSDYPSIVWLGAGRYEGLSTLLLYGAVFIGVSSFGEMKRGYFWAIGLAAAVVSLVAIGQLFGYDILSLYPAGYDYYDGDLYYSGRFLGTIGNIDLLSGFYCLAFPVCLFSLLLGKHKYCLLFLIPLLLMAYVLYRAAVAGSAVGIGGCLLLLLPLVAAPRLAAKIPHSRLIAWLVVIVVMVGGLLFVYSTDAEQGTLFEASQILHGNIADSYGSSRVLIWRNTLALVGEHPLLGGGPDTLAARLELYFNREVEDTGQSITTRVDAAHNEYLNYLVNLGAPAAAAYLLLLLVIARRLLKVSLADDLSVICGAAVLAYALQGFFSFSLCVVAPLYWLLLGLSAGGGDRSHLLDA